MIDEKRLIILTQSAKYDVSCSSSGSRRQNVPGGLGNAAFGGICHSFTSDGRCVSLLKILLSNKCAYDCQYCVNRRSNDVPRASASPEEICELVAEFYKRNYIEGLFLSSAVEISSDRTMELLLDTVIRLRKLYRFNGYIHLKGIPNADPLLIQRAGAYVDRMSFNIELPSERSLKLLAPQKSKNAIVKPMRLLSSADFKENARGRGAGKFLPAGQTTQMIVGASPETDGQILRLSQGLYDAFSLKRVYYSAYIAVNPQSRYLPAKSANLLREHRLYQADWLLRFYGFTAEEIVREDGFLDEEYDPKCAWAVRHMENFPVEVNTAPVEMLVRVPGIGIRSAYRIREARRRTRLTFDDLKKMRVVLKRAKHFITADGKFFGEENYGRMKTLLALQETNENAEQPSFLTGNEIEKSVITGEI